jgi:threonine synthase
VVPKTLSTSSPPPPALETVVINTGHGLKTLDAVGDAVGPAATIDPSYAAFVATGIA